MQLRGDIDNGKSAFLATVSYSNSNIISGTITLYENSQIYCESKVTIQFGKQGRIEITVGEIGVGNQKFEKFMSLEMRNGKDRMIRAIFDTPRYDFTQKFTNNNFLSQV